MSETNYEIAACALGWIVVFCLAFVAMHFG